MSTTPTAIALPLSTSWDTGRITFTIPIGANHPRSSVPSISGNGSDTGTHRFTYDENGQKSSSTDPRGHVATYGYDIATGSRRRPNRSGKTNPTTYFYYDGWNLTQEIPTGSRAGRTYVQAGRVEEIVASEMSGCGITIINDARRHWISLARKR